MSLIKTSRDHLRQVCIEGHGLEAGERLVISSPKVSLDGKGIENTIPLACDTDGGSALQFIFRG